MMRMFEHKCSEGHITEALLDDSVKTTVCKECGRVASRIISSPRIRLEGITGAFPSAHDAWARKHEEAARAYQKKSDS